MPPEDSVGIAAVAHKLAAPTAALGGSPGALALRTPVMEQPGAGFFGQGRASRTRVFRIPAPVAEQAVVGAEAPEPQPPTLAQLQAAPLRLARAVARWRPEPPWRSNPDNRRTRGELHARTAGRSR